jgi:pyruvate dehydrogenase E1 component beta subunit
MPTPILMPALSPTMTEGNLAKWLKNEGDAVKSGDVIAEIETDKATMEVEAVDEGTIGRILVQAGTEGVKVNEPIAMLLAEGEDKSALDGEAGAKAQAEAAPDQAAAIRKPDSDTLMGEKKPATADTQALPKEVRAPRPSEVPEGTQMVKQTVREALRDAMAEEMRRDPDVFLMGEEVAEYQGAYKISQGMLEEFTAKRVIDTPITEYGFTGLGVGAGDGGPEAHHRVHDLQLRHAGDRPRHQLGLQDPLHGRRRARLPDRVPRPERCRRPGGAQHSQEYSTWYAHCPGLKVVAPYSAADAKGLLKAAIRDPNPVVFLENEVLYGQSFEVPKLDDFVLPIGKGKILREGRHVTITAFSLMVDRALKAAEKLAEEGIEAEVIDLRTLRPLDVELIVDSVKKTNRIVSVEEGWPRFGMGAEVAAIMMEEAFDYLDAPVHRVTGKDVPMPYAANLERLALPQVDDVVAAAKAVCYRA